MTSLSLRGSYPRNFFLATAGILVILGTAFTMRFAGGANVVYIENSPVEVRMLSVTNYSEYDSCHYENCAMASGRSAYKGAVACPRDWKLGTKVEIGDKVYVCEDRYNANLSDRIDIFVGYGPEAYKEAINYGYKTLAVKIYK